MGGGQVVKIKGSPKALMDVRAFAVKSPAKPGCSALPGIPIGR
jgi:hypothetical protein